METQQPQMETILSRALKLMPNSTIQELGQADVRIADDLVRALAVLEKMERDGKAKRTAKSTLYPRNYEWVLVPTTAV